MLRHRTLERVLVPTAAFVGGDEDIFPAKRVSESDHSVVPMASQNAFTVPVNTGDVYLFRPLSNRLVRSACKAENLTLSNTTLDDK